MKKCLRTAILCLCAVVALPAQDTTGAGSIRGVVRDEQDSHVDGVRVCVSGTSRCAVSANGGAFRISEVRSGSYSLEITQPGKATYLSKPIEVKAGLESFVDVSTPELASVVETITVTEPVFIAPEEVKTSAFLVQREEVFRSAGALQDVSQYVRTLPGAVIGADDFRNDIIVRGGSPLENLFIVDNVEIPNINAFANFASAGGTVSLLDAALLEDVTFLTGGYPAPYINRASSVLQVAQREGSRDEFHGRATLGFAGAGAIFEGPIREGKGSWVVSARRSFLDLFTDDVGFGGVPVVYTLNSKAVYDLTARDRIWVVNLSGRDNIRLGLAEGRPPEEEIDNFDIRYRGWRSATGFNWQRLLGSSSVGLLGVTHSEARVGSTIRDLVLNGVPPPDLPVPDLISGSPLVFREDSAEGETTVKYDLTTYASVLGKLQTGGSVKLFRINYDTASPFGFDTPYSVQPGLNSFGLRRSFVAGQNSAYFQSTRNLTPRLNLTWGGRVDHYEFIGRTRFSPRAGASYRITDKLSWRGSFGSYYQQPFFIFLAAFPENRGLTPFRADHFVTGFSYAASNTLRFTLEAYRKNYKDYPVSLQFPSLSLAAAGDTFNVREILFPLTSAGRGMAQGIELFVEKKFTDRWYGQANVAVSRSRQAGLDGILRLGAFDYPFVFNTVGGYRLNSKWEFSARIAYLAGRPFTPFDTELSRQQRRGIFDLSRVNEERLPDYFRFDVRVDRLFTVRDNPLRIFVGLQNVTNRANAAGFLWNRRTNELQINDQLGIFPLIGMDWRF